MASICRWCAIARGGQSPEGHCATVSPAKCQFCKEDRICADTADWCLTEQGNPMGRRPTNMEVD